MSLYEYLQILRTRWYVVAGTVVAALLAAAVFAALSTPVYQAGTRILFGFAGKTQSGQLSRTFTYASSMVQSYARVATLPAVLDPVIAELGLDTDAERLAGQVSASAKLDSLILQITVRDPDPRRAAAIANGVARELLATTERLERGGTATAAGDRPAEAARFTGQVVSVAEPPREPVWPRTSLLLQIGLGLGLLGGVMLAVSLALLDTRIIGRSEVAAVTSLPVMGTVPAEPAARRRGLRGLRRRLRGDRTGRAPKERIQELGANLLALIARDRVRTVAFTSAYDDRASVTTVAELGAALARSGNRVLLVDADVRSPQLSAVGASGRMSRPAGLAEVLAGRARWEQVVRQGHPGGPYVLSAGSEALGQDALASAATSRVLEEVGRHFDVVLVKAAPVLRTADGLVVSALTDRVVVVTDEAAMSRELLVDVLGSLDAVGARPLGVVLHA